MRNLCCKCPHYYEQHGYECDDVDWGCTAFGSEFENCPSFWKSQKRNAFKYKMHTDTIKTEKGYKVFGYEGNFIGYSDDFMPKMKGGHRHNHIFNVCHRLNLRGKNSRRIPLQDKKLFVKVFWENLHYYPFGLYTYLSMSRKRK